ncbi:metallophosphoesterase [Lysinibacillus sp. SGAir0095]|uniref:metallophosphoesterase n=1 Tax=Lysinibacillus sp. SGAir0095 TaxID=2070463 RepID=UPI0010CD3663|nr:metallophosphoesterase [Lysinibacillus sp. SGAir0095]QCR31943.1 metallophosphoesterase [Lysinibacillus sp. SGAir0095]
MSKIAMIIGVTLILTFYGGTSFYIGRKIYQWLKLLIPHINGTTYVVIYGFFALSLIMVFLPLPTAIKGLMSWIGSYWMGILIYLLLFFLVADLVIWLLSILKIIPTPISPNIHFSAGLAAILLTISFVSYGIYNANRIKNVSYDIEMEENAAGMKIVLVSDLHLGAVNSEKRLENVVENINNLEPDLVCIAGDIFNDDFNTLKNPEKAIDLLKSIKSEYGVYGSLGNHDGGKTFNQMIKFLEKSEIRLLNDEYVVIDERLVLFGRVDPSPIGGFGGMERKEITEILASLDTTLPIVVMDHTPTNLEQYGDEIDLILAGHTHRGQIFPGNLITNAIFDVDYGHYQKDADSPQVIVTSGAGTWGMPMRVGSNNEVVSINLY